MNRILKIFAYIFISLVAILAISFAILYTPSKSYKTIKKEYSLPNSQFIDIMGMPTHFTIDGQGEKTLVLLHGTAASLHTWQAWVNNLKNDFKIVRVDLPGFGLTGRNPNNDYTHQMYMQFLHDFLTTTEIKNCYLAGNSFGGDLAWNYALLYPNQVEKLILIDAAGYPLDPSKVLGFKLAKNPITRPATEFITPKFIVEKSVKQVYGNPNLVTDDIVDRYYNLLLMEGNRKGLNQRLLQYKSSPDDIKKINQPTLIMWGEKDILIPVEDARKFDNDIKNSVSIVYSQLGHIPMEEAPDETSKAIRKFLLQE